MPGARRRSLITTPILWRRLSLTCVHVCKSLTISIRGGYLPHTGQPHSGLRLACTYRVSQQGGWVSAEGKGKKLLFSNHPCHHLGVASDVARRLPRLTPRPTRLPELQGNQRLMTMRRRAISPRGCVRTHRPASEGKRNPTERLAELGSRAPAARVPERARVRLARWREEAPSRCAHTKVRHGRSRRQNNTRTVAYCTGRYDGTHVRDVRVREKRVQ